MKNVTQYTGWNQIAEFHNLLLLETENASCENCIHLRGKHKVKCKSEKCIDVEYTGQARSQYMTRKVNEVDNA